LVRILATDLYELGGERSFAGKPNESQREPQKILPRLKTTDRRMVFGTEMPHGDRERFAGRKLAKPKDISVSGLTAMLQNNPLRLYGLR
jgi:predicted TIM-barrel fold metal-dependent hydrolase